jgi:hypothetical protein
VIELLVWLYTTKFLSHAFAAAGTIHMAAISANSDDIRLLFITGALLAV